MKFLLLREKRRRYLYYLFESKYFALKFIIANEHLPIHLRWNASLRLFSHLRRFSFVKFNNRCFLTGRSKSFNKAFRLSRIKTRSYALMGKLPYLKKR